MILRLRFLQVNQSSSSFNLSECSPYVQYASLRASRDHLELGTEKVQTTEI